MSMNLPFRGAKSDSGSLLTGRAPQVNLLPPEVRAARSFGAVRRMLIFAMLASLVIAVAVALFAVAQEAQAKSALAAEEKRTQDLLAQQAEFAEVPLVLGVLGDAEEVRSYAMATDVAWAKYLRAIGAALPKDVSLDRLTVETEAPLIPLAPPESVMSPPGVARITFATRSAQVQDTVALLDALDGLPGFRDAFFTQHKIAEREGSVFYEVEATVELDAHIFSGRFTPEEADGVAAPEATDTGGED